MEKKTAIVCEALVPFVAMLVMEGCTIALTITANSAMENGMNQFVFVAYSNALSSLILLPYSYFFNKERKFCSLRELFSCKLLVRFFLLGFTGGKDEQPLSKANGRPQIWLKSHYRPAQRKRCKKRRGFSLEDPRTLWRLGLMSARHCVILFNQGLLGASETEQSVRISRDSGHVKGNWEGSSSLLWAYMEKRRISSFTRLYLSYLFYSNLTMHVLVLDYWGFGYKSTTNFVLSKTLSKLLWIFSEPSDKNKQPFKKVLCPNEITLKEHYKNKNRDGHLRLSPTMAEEALKGSGQSKPYEAGPSGIKNVLCSGKYFSKELFTHMNTDGHLGPPPTMAEKALKGSKQTNLYEESQFFSCHFENDNGSRICYVHRICFGKKLMYPLVFKHVLNKIMWTLSHWIHLLIYECNAASSMPDRMISEILDCNIISCIKETNCGPEYTLLIYCKYFDDVVKTCCLAQLTCESRKCYVNLIGHSGVHASKTKAGQIAENEVVAMGWPVKLSYSQMMIDKPRKFRYNRYTSKPVFMHIRLYMKRKSLQCNLTDRGTYSGCTLQANINIPFLYLHLIPSASLGRITRRVFAWIQLQVNFVHTSCTAHCFMIAHEYVSLVYLLKYISPGFAVTTSDALEIHELSNLSWSKNLHLWASFFK